MECDVQKKHPLGIYIHIPFCIKKCDYCDFLSAPATQEIKQKYIKSLLTEIESYIGRTEQYIVSTVFIGGGTPSCIHAKYIEYIMEALRKVFRFDEEALEATVEINPATVTMEKLLSYKRSGINRISFGLQSADNEELRLLGRIHSYEQFLENYKLAREMNFKNINIDIISALPGQSVLSWETTLKKVIGLRPEHISAYSLIIEEGTPFYDRYNENSVLYKELPEEDTDRLMYYKTNELLKENGYFRYEISNYAKPGYECRHNVTYWRGLEYLGMGLGASSLINHTRFQNISDLELYINKCNFIKKGRITSIYNNIEANAMTNDGILEDSIGIRNNIENLTIEKEMEEFMFLGLRMCQGIQKSAFYLKFNQNIEAIYGDVIQELQKNKLIVEDEDRIYLTDYGVDVSNIVLSNFLLS